MRHHRPRPRRLPHNSNPPRITPKLLDIILNPTQRIPLILKPKIRKPSLLKLPGSRETKVRETVLYGYHDDGLVHCYAALDEVGALVEDAVDGGDFAEDAAGGAGFESSAVTWGVISMDEGGVEVEVHCLHPDDHG